MWSPNCSSTRECCRSTARASSPARTHGGTLSFWRPETTFLNLLSVCVCCLLRYDGLWWCDSARRKYIVWPSQQQKQEKRLLINGDTGEGREAQRSRKSRVKHGRSRKTRIYRKAMSRVIRSARFYRHPTSAVRHTFRYAFDSAEPDGWKKNQIKTKEKREERRKKNTFVGWWFAIAIEKFLLKNSLLVLLRTEFWFTFDAHRWRDALAEDHEHFDFIVSLEGSREYFKTYLQFTKTLHSALFSQLPFMVEMQKFHSIHRAVLSCITV